MESTSFGCPSELLQAIMRGIRFVPEGREHRIGQTCVAKQVEKDINQEDIILANERFSGVVAYR